MLLHKGVADQSGSMMIDLHPELAPLQEAIRFSPINRYRAGDSIFAQGDRRGHLYLVEFGCVRVCRLTAEGRRHVGAFHFAGDVFGFEGAPERQTFAEAIESSGVRCLRLDEKARYARGVVDLMLGHLGRVQDHLLILGTQNALERVGAFLLEVAERQGADTMVRLPMSRSDIADHLGLTLETVSRVVRRLQEMGYIHLVGARKIRLLDRLALEQLGD